MHYTQVMGARDRVRSAAYDRPDMRPVSKNGGDHGPIKTVDYAANVSADGTFAMQEDGCGCMTYYRSTSPDSEMVTMRYVSCVGHYTEARDEAVPRPVWMRPLTPIRPSAGATMGEG